MYRHNFQITFWEGIITFKGRDQNSKLSHFREMVEQDQTDINEMKSTTSAKVKSNATLQACFL